MLKTLPFFLFVGIFSCTSNQSNPAKPIPAKVDTLKNKLIGQWGGLGEDSPVWEITADSIYYFQRKKSYPYKILDGNFIIELPESKGILRNISVVEDTMTFSDPPGVVIKGYRFKSKN